VFTRIASQITRLGKKYGSVNGLIPFTAPFHAPLDIEIANANFRKAVPADGKLGSSNYRSSFDVLGKEGNKFVSRAPRSDSLVSQRGECRGWVKGPRPNILKAPLRDGPVMTGDQIRY
jgi:hypothetical protein